MIYRVYYLEGFTSFRRVLERVLISKEICILISWVISMLLRVSGSYNHIDQVPIHYSQVFEWDTIIIQNILAIKT